MRRKTIGIIVILALGLLVEPLTAEAQQPTKVYWIGVLHAGRPGFAVAEGEALRQGLRALGYVEGQNLVMEYRYAEGSEERLRDLAAELVQLLGRDKARYLVGTSPHPPRLEPDLRLLTASGSALSDLTLSSLCGMMYTTVGGYSCYQPPWGL
jgi:hypothetical protein